MKHFEIWLVGWLALATLGCSSSGPSQAGPDALPASPTATVVIDKLWLDPPLVRVAVGGTVTWYNMDGVFHHLVDGLPGYTNIGQLFDSTQILGDPGLTPFRSFSVVFNQPGQINYHCTEPHPEPMLGKISVE